MERGRPKTIDSEQLLALLANGTSQRETARRLGVTQAAVSKALSGLPAERRAALRLRQLATEAEGIDAPPEAEAELERAVSALREAATTVEAACDDS